MEAALKEERHILPSARSHPLPHRPPLVGPASTVRVALPRSSGIPARPRLSSIVPAGLHEGNRRLGACRVHDEKDQSHNGDEHCHDPPPMHARMRSSASCKRKLWLHFRGVPCRAAVNPCAQNSHYSNEQILRNATEPGSLKSEPRPRYRPSSPSQQPIQVGCGDC
jgi:hypothetical protein